MAAWDNLSVTAEEYRELDDELIIVLNRFRHAARRAGCRLMRA
jgi:hypothetical protein